MTDSNHFPVYTILHHPGDFAGRSGMYPLAEALGASPIYYEATWQHIARKSWSLGNWLRRYGCAYYGSQWNSLLPLWGEYKLARRIEKRGGIVHFLWAEFAGPRHPAWLRKKKHLLVGTFHASARRQPVVLQNCRTFASYDAITLMSRSQAPYLLEAGVPEDRLHVFLHGVDIQWYCPAPRADNSDERPLKAILIGSTERDHEFMADVMRKIPENIMHLEVCTPAEQQVHYRGVHGVTIMPFLRDADLLAWYRQADLLVMPMVDCTANNAVLESMACGTPVMVNRVGGIPEYVDTSCNMVMDDKNIAEWVDRIVGLAENRAYLESLRPQVRSWAETFDWNVRAKPYMKLFRTLLGRSEAS